MKFFTEYTNLALFAIALISGALLFWPVLLRRGRGLSTSDATQLINRRNAVVIDLRDAADYAQGHLPQARHLAFAEFAARLPQVAKNKKTPVLLVCQNGRQSEKAETLAQQAGYAEVFVLQGGVNAWKQAGMPIVKQGATQ